jgi:hypothetical protein
VLLQSCEQKKLLLFKKILILKNRNSTLHLAGADKSQRWWILTWWRVAALLFKIWILLLSFPMALKETRWEMGIGLYLKLPDLLKSTYNACNDIILKTYPILHHLQAHCHTNVTFIHSRRSSFLRFYISWCQQLSSRTNACRLINVTWGCHIPIDIKIAFFQASLKL